METRLMLQKSRFPVASSRPATLQSVYISETVWSVENDHTLVMMCSDPRYRPATEEFLRNHFKIERYDIIAVPGGPAAILYSAPYYNMACVRKSSFCMRFIISGGQLLSCMTIAAIMPIAIRTPVHTFGMTGKSMTYTNGAKKWKGLYRILRHGGCIL